MSNDFHAYWKDKKITVLSGGVGGAKLVHGLARNLPPDTLRVVVNTGDDFEFLGFWISPDLDTIMYTLSDRAPVQRGWGIENDSFHVLNAIKDLGGPDWFLLGDQDLAVHALRSDKRRKGARLTEITQELFGAHSLSTPVLPMADAPQPTVIRDTNGVEHAFQDWLVKLRATPVVQKVIFEGEGRASSETLDAIQNADLVILPPSNPFVSIDPILRLDSVRALLRTTPVIGVSPIIGGQAVKGPLASMIPALLQVDASANALAEYYADILDLYVVAHGDRCTSRTSSKIDAASNVDAAPSLDAVSTSEEVPQVECDIMMSDVPARDRLAHEVLALSRTHGLIT